MANEITVGYWKVAAANKDLSSGVYGEYQGGDTYNAATVVGPFDGDVVSITASADVFVALGADNSVSATANGANSFKLASGTTIDIQVTPNQKYLDTAV